MRALAAVSILLALSAGPAMADTIRCESPDQAVSIDLDVDFDATREDGVATRVRYKSEDYVSSTDPSETEYEPDTLAFSEVSYDRIQVGLESPNVGPMTFLMDIVRTYAPEPGDEPDKAVVIAGVARLSSQTVTLVCSGW